jgi:hypothetical protein
MLKIYKIIDNTNGNVYIGKTKQKYLSSRLSVHRSGAKNCRSCSSYEIIKNGDYKIELIEETEDDSRERYWVENTVCVNKNIPGRTGKEWGKEYYKVNKEEIKKYKKVYRKDNKEKIKLFKHNKHKYQSSWGGDKRRQNNLLSIDPNLFF